MLLSVMKQQDKAILLYSSQFVLLCFNSYSLIDIHLILSAAFVSLYFPNHGLRRLASDAKTLYISGAPRAVRSAARGRSPIAKEIYPFQKIW